MFFPNFNFKENDRQSLIKFYFQVFSYYHIIFSPSLFYFPFFFLILLCSLPALLFHPIFPNLLYFPRSPKQPLKTPLRPQNTQKENIFISSILNQNFPIPDISINTKRVKKASPAMQIAEEGEFLLIGIPI